MSAWASPGFLALLFLFVVLTLIAWNQPRASGRSAQYEEFVPGFGGGTDPFFARLYHQLQSDLTQSALPFGAVGFGPRQLFAKRHVLSGRAVYLEVRYQEMSYFVYATPAPGGLHVSTWLFSKHELWLQHPILKWLVAFHLTHMTLFQFDIMRLFHSVVQGALGAVLNDLRQEQGLLPLESYERRPVLSGFYASMCYGSGSPSLAAPGMVAPVMAGGGAGGGGMIAPITVLPGTPGTSVPGLGRGKPEVTPPRIEALERAEPNITQPGMTKANMIEPSMAEVNGATPVGAALSFSRFTSSDARGSSAKAPAPAPETSADAESTPA